MLKNFEKALKKANEAREMLATFPTLTEYEARRGAYHTETDAAKKEAKQQDLHKYHKALADTQTQRTLQQIVCKLWERNAKAMLFADVLPLIVAEWNKHEGKAYGEKTRQKIEKAIQDASGGAIYIYIPGSNKIHICPKARALHYTYQITAWTNYPLTDSANKVRAINADCVRVYGVKYEPKPTAAAKKLVALSDKARGLDEQLRQTCREFNALAGEALESLTPSSVRAWIL